MKLTDLHCRNAEPKEKPYKLTDGHGMYLLVEPNGAKYWRLKYRFGGREKSFALGVYPDVTLAKARLEMKKARSLVKDDIDPMDVRREEKRNRPKPDNRKNAFNLSLSQNGGLTIETKSRIIHLTAAQTEALRAFFEATNKEDTPA